jgi:hypothetical protein
MLAAALARRPELTHSPSDFPSVPRSGPTPQTFLDAEVDLDKLGLSEDLLEVIREGRYERWNNDRSRAVFFVCCELIRSNAKDADIVSILLDPRWPIGAHVRDQGNPRKYAERQVERAKATAKESFVTDQHGFPLGKRQENVRMGLARLGVEVRYDSFSDLMVVKGLDDFDRLEDAALDRIWLELDARFRLRPSKEFLLTVIQDDARKDAFHPVCDFLKALEWDGTERIDRWLTTYAAAKDTPYVRAVGALMLIAAVRRVRQPGCKFDELPVLESPTQGTDKSTAISTLAVKAAWFTDYLPLNADPKVVIEQTRGKWIVEAGELSGMRRGDIDKLKGLLSRSSDRGRLAYARCASEVKRQFIAIGTTNNREYLKDQTGNRRFWPVEINRFDIESLRRDRDQLWAEAAAREAKGESIRLNPSLWDAASVEQSERTVTDPYREALEHYLADYDDARISAHDVWKLLDVKTGHRNQDMNARMGEAMRAMGFERKNVRIQSKLVKGYVRGKGQKHLGVVVPRPTGDESVVPEPFIVVEGLI